MHSTQSAVALGTDRETRQPVYLGATERKDGLYIVGLTGVGKSTLLLNMILQDIDAGRGVCLIDPHARLVDAVLACRDIPPERLYLLDPADYQHPFGLNLFECSDPNDPTITSNAISYILGVFRTVWGKGSDNESWGVQIEELLTEVARVFIQTNRYTMVDIRRFLLNDAFRNHVLSQVSSRASEYWYESYNPNTNKPQFTASTLRRVRKLAENDILYYILGQSQSTIPIAQIMDQKKILLLKMDKTSIGEDAVSLLGLIIISQILQETLRRARRDESTLSPFALYCDEYQLFANRYFHAFFSEGRKFGIQTTIAHQWRTQLDTADRDATLSVQNKVIFQVNPRDARELKTSFREILNTSTPKPLTNDPVRFLLAHVIQIHSSLG